MIDHFWRPSYDYDDGRNHQTAYGVKKQKPWRKHHIHEEEVDCDNGRDDDDDDGI